MTIKERRTTYGFFVPYKSVEKVAKVGRVRKFPWYEAFDEECKSMHEVLRSVRIRIVDEDTLEIDNGEFVRRLTREDINNCWHQYEFRNDRLLIVRMTTYRWEEKR